jgi:cytochrome P450
MLYTLMKSNFTLDVWLCAPSKAQRIGARAMEYNPLSPEVQANPYPYYAELRRDNPVAWLAPLQCWAISRYTDVDFALRNPQLFSSPRTPSAGAEQNRPLPCGRISGT